MRKYLFLLTLLWNIAYAAPTATEALWQKGNDWYKNKQYDSAIACFEQIAKGHPTDAILYYNLGNTYYRMNLVPKAVLNYERAIWIKPDFKEAKENLLLTKNRINNRLPEVGEIFFINWWNHLTRGDRANTWAIISLVLFIGLIIVLSYNRMKRTADGAPIPGQVPFFMGLFWLCFFILSYFSAMNSNNSGLAVVMQNDSPMMNVNLAGKPLGMIPEGTTIHIKTEKGDWAEVTLPDGRTGWIALANIEKV